MITLLYGPNAFAKRRRLDELVRQFAAAYGEQGIERFDGEDLEPARLPEIFQGVSLFAADKLIIIRDAAANKPLWEALEPYVVTPDESTRVVLYEREPDKRTRTFKALQKQAEIAECKELPSGELVPWLVSQSGGRLDRRLATALVQRAGTDQQRLNNELDKLLVHEAVTERHIEALVEPGSEGSAFELLDAVLAGRPARVAEIINSIKLSEDPYRLFGLLISNIQVLAALMADKNKTPQQVASDLGVHPFVATKLSQARRTMPMEAVRRAVRILADTDTALKSTGHDPWLLLQNAMTKIAAR